MKEELNYFISRLQDTKSLEFLLKKVVKNH